MCHENWSLCILFVGCCRRCSLRRSLQGWLLRTLNEIKVTINSAKTEFFTVSFHRRGRRNPLWAPPPLLSCCCFNSDDSKCEILSCFARRMPECEDIAALAAAECWDGDTANTFLSLLCAFLCACPPHAHTISPIFDQGESSCYKKKGLLRAEGRGETSKHGNPFIVAYV